MIDTHCHLNFHAFNSDINDVIARAEKAGVTAIIIPGAKLSSSRKAVELSGKNESCFSAVGIHPHHLTEYNQLGNTLITKNLQKIISNKTVAVGEIGLDYYHYQDYPPITEENKIAQNGLFRLQLKLAKKNNLPVIIHCREAQSDVLKTVSEFIKEYGQISGVFHCFDGNKDYLSTVLQLGFYVGFDGNITYKQNQHLRELLKLTPFDRLLLETDAPFLTPEPFRGTRNEPAYMTYITGLVAEITKTEPGNIGRITSRNAQTLFKLKKRPGSAKIALS